MGVARKNHGLDKKPARLRKLRWTRFAIHPVTAPAWRKSSGSPDRGITMPPLRLPGEVLEFWFSEQSRALWFERNTAFDEELRARFGASVAAACVGELDYWARAVDSSLALVLLLDQFPRNIHRGTLRAFAGDARARTIAAMAIDRGFDRRTPLDRRFFFYLPFEHSEDPKD